MHWEDIAPGFVALLVALREVRGWKPTRLAGMAGVQAGTVLGWENKGREPMDQTLVKVAATFGAVDGQKLLEAAGRPYLARRLAAAVIDRIGPMDLPAVEETNPPAGFPEMLRTVSAVLTELRNYFDEWERRISGDNNGNDDGITHMSEAS